MCNITVSVPYIITKLVYILNARHEFNKKGVPESRLGLRDSFCHALIPFNLNLSVVFLLDWAFWKVCGRHMRNLVFGQADQAEGWRLNRKTDSQCHINVVYLVLTTGEVPRKGMEYGQQKMIRHLL